MEHTVEILKINRMANEASSGRKPSPTCGIVTEVRGNGAPDLFGVVEEFPRKPLTFSDDDP